jgi:hypothetical protein
MELAMAVTRPGSEAAIATATSRSTPDLSELQGRTFGAPGLTAPAVSSEDEREQLKGK